MPSICCTRSLGEAFCEGYKQSRSTNHIFDSDEKKYEAIIEKSLFGRLITASPSSVTENRTVIDLSTLSIDESSVDEWIDTFTDEELALLSSALKYYHQFNLSFEIDNYLNSDHSSPCEPIDIDMKALKKCCECLDVNELNEVYVKTHPLYSYEEDEKEEDN